MSKKNFLPYQDERQLEISFVYGKKAAVFYLQLKTGHPLRK
jgi:hypothetical protein